MNVLILDIETTPNLAHVWGMWQQNVGINQIMAPTEVLCWAAKWESSDDIIFYGLNKNTKEEMAHAMWYLLDSADVVVHYNGTKFDIPHLNREFLELGMKPPSTYKQVDLLNTIRSQFNFPSNKLDYVAQALGLGKKTTHSGHELWVKCLNGDSVAWDTMQEYNENDVLLTEELYHTIKPWIKSLPNMVMYEEEEEAIAISCPSCGGVNVKKKGFEYTSVSKFQRYVCSDCGKNSRGRSNLFDRENLLVGV